MYIDELIEELEKWKSKTAEVTINGTPIDRVTCGNGENIIIIPQWEVSVDEQVDELEDEVEDLRNELNDAECDIEADEAHIGDLEKILHETNRYLETYADLLEEMKDKGAGYFNYNADDKEKVEELKERINKNLYHWEY